mmetsp:Transcript_26991/g.42160  ORF Transcript_26991/g.42160 Transcript_26991/m.42160 type:complete len:139 (+) Transcript_26991:94-510(+)
MCMFLRDLASKTELSLAVLTPMTPAGSGVLNPSALRFPSPSALNSPAPLFRIIFLGPVQSHYSGIHLTPSPLEVIPLSITPLTPRTTEIPQLLRPCFGAPLGPISKSQYHGITSTPHPLERMPCPSEAYPQPYASLAS